MAKRKPPPKKKRVKRPAVLNPPVTAEVSISEPLMPVEEPRKPTSTRFFDWLFDWLQRTFK